MFYHGCYLKLSCMVICFHVLIFFSSMITHTQGQTSHENKDFVHLVRTVNLAPQDTSSGGWWNLLLFGRNSFPLPTLGSMGRLYIIGLLWVYAEMTL